MHDLSSERDRKRIVQLNDVFRRTFVGGSLCITSGLQLRGPTFVRAALKAVRDQEEFSRDNDPNGEHDFGALTVYEQQVFWKIDYFDPTMTRGSENPADAERTRRVLTVMLADEY
jgi:hypothetical protein